MKRKAPPTRLSGDDPGLVALAFPLRGEWQAAHTPAHRVPSHGVHLWAQTYAFDLWRVRPGRAGQFHDRSILRHLTLGVRLADCPGFGQPVHAVFDGTVEKVSDLMADRDRVHLVVDLLRVLRNGLTVRPDADPGPFIGNHVILRHATTPDLYALYAHLRRGSATVAAGDRVRTGDPVGAVGHTGNSTAPHLHFQLMDGPDPRTATGIPCAFEEYQRWDAGAWTPVASGIPGLNERIRSA